MSILAPAVAQRAAEPELLLHPADMEGLRLQAGDPVQVHSGGEILELPVGPEPSLRPGTAAVPVGFPGLPWLGLPAWGNIRGVLQA